MYLFVVGAPAQPPTPTLRSHLCSLLTNFDLNTHVYSSLLAFSALTLVVGRQKGHLGRKTLCFKVQTPRYGG